MPEDNTDEAYELRILTEMGYEFKVGDRVEYTGTATCRAVGQKGTVRRVSSRCLQVDWDDPAFSDIEPFTTSLTLIKETNNNMNNYQHAIIAHLSSSRERRQALQDLTQDENILAGHLSEDDIKRRVNDYLVRNPRGFCADGIKRFRDATGIHDKPQTRTVRVTLDIETDSNSDHLHPGVVGDYELGGALTEHVREIGTLTKSSWGRLSYPFNITKVTEVSSVVQP